MAWHQDVTYWGLEPSRAMSGWLAIDDADVENGCMMVVPGSHRRVSDPGTADRTGNLLSIDQEIPAARVDERGGQRAAPGRPDVVRRRPARFTPATRAARRAAAAGSAIRFRTPDVRQVELNSLSHRWSAVLVRGVDGTGTSRVAREVPWRDRR